MQINRYFNAAMLAYQSSDMSKKTRTAQPKGFTQMLQDTHTQATGQADKAAATNKVSKADEMAAFKQEIYEELDEIGRMHSSATLSNSVHITEDGFKRMKDDPAYRKEIMDWLRADAKASYKVPYSVHITTTITGSGATCYGATVFPNDSSATKAAKKALADKKAEGAFYRFDRSSVNRKAAQKKRYQDGIIRERQQRAMMQKIRLDKQIAQKAQHKELMQEAMNQKYLDTGITETLYGKSWSI